MLRTLKISFMECEVIRFFFPEIVFYSSSIKKVLDDLREVTMSELLLPAGYEGYQDPI